VKTGMLERWLKRPKQMADPTSIERIGSAELGPCSCCGHRTRRVWGAVHRQPGGTAIYYVEWTEGRVLEDDRIAEVRKGTARETAG